MNGTGDAARNYIVLRRSPDWLTFDIEQTRQFLAEFPLPNDMIIRFAERWGAFSQLNYQAYRHALKSVALATVEAVRDAIVVSHADVPNLVIDDRDLLFFIDDDDWVSPDLFQHLRGAPGGEQGWMWLSIFVGKMFVDSTTERADSPIVQEREPSGIVYTNNYAVTGATWKRLGPEVLLEHYRAQEALDDGRFVPDRLDRYLTAANKHLCCTVSVHYNADSPLFQTDLRQCLVQTVEELQDVELSSRIEWIAEPLARFIAVNRQALGIARV